MVGGAGRATHTHVPWIYSGDADALGTPAQRFPLSAQGEPVVVPLRTTAHRRTPPLFGLGQLEAIPTEQLRRASDPADADPDGISGRLPWREDCPGRFGWQSTVCDIQTFVRVPLVTSLAS